MWKNKIDTSAIIVELVRDRVLLTEQNEQKDLLIQELQNKLSNYERSNVQW